MQRNINILSLIKCINIIILKNLIQQGDSGGPIMQYINNKWNLVGVVSNGDAMCTGKGIYTNISHYFDWIVQNIVIAS